MEIVSVTAAGRSDGFSMPMTTFEDMMVEYYAFDFDGNVAICQVNITVPDDTPPSLACPQSFVIELVDAEESYHVDFRKMRAQVNVSDAVDSEVTVTFLPERATIPIGGYENVSVVAVDKAGNRATCYFQVAVKPTPCVDWELKAPMHGSISCAKKGDVPTSNGLTCTATCQTGFRFTDGEERKEFTCAEGAPWAPSKVVPDCVTEDTTLATYDVQATITYKAVSGNTGPATSEADSVPSEETSAATVTAAAVSESCLEGYVQHVAQFEEALARILTDRCSAGTGGVDIQVAFKPTVSRVAPTDSSVVEVTYTLMVTPALSQPRVYDLCGQTHDLIFDLSIQRTNQLIADLLEVPGAIESCPTLRATRSNVSRGFVCR
jgi:hypothetical protein